MRTAQNLETLVARMRNVGDQLAPYNFPQADPKLEDDLNVIKTKEAVVDGYAVILHFSRSDYRTHYLETLQILGKNSPFLPFNVVFKIVRRFLGSHHLSLAEPIQDNRKIYCWTVCVDPRGVPIPMPQQDEAEECLFEGCKYKYIDPSHISFY